MQIGLIGLLLGLAQAPAAIDPGCILEAVSAADRTALVLAAEREEEANGPAHQRIQSAAIQCREQLGWDAARTGTSAGLAISVIFRDGAGPMLTRNGVPADAIDRWFAGQAPSFRTDPEITEEEGQQMVLDLHRGGVTRERIETNGRLIGVYLGALIMIERVDRGLPLD